MNVSDMSCWEDDWLLPPEVSGSGSASNDLKDVDDLAGPSEGYG